MLAYYHHHSKVSKPLLSYKIQTLDGSIACEIILPWGSRSRIRVKVLDLGQVRRSALKKGKTQKLTPTDIVIHLE